MSLLPTTRLSSGGSTGIEPGGIQGVQDEDILLVDFQPVVVPNPQILSSPSTTTSTAMYPVPPPIGPLPGAHLVGLNHHPSVSSDGVTSPISATGSSGKANSNNPNNYSLVNLSNHVHLHNNNISRDESDFNYPPTTNQVHHPQLPNNLINNAVLSNNDVQYDEDDEFARHQAMAQPNFMGNKRRSRRFVTRESHNHVWDNANHVGLSHHPQSHPAQMSSTLSSSEDSDTGFLMGTRKTAYTRRSVQRVVDPHPSNHTGGGGGGNVSPSATVGLLPNVGNKKRVRRRRPAARNRKPVANQHDKLLNPSDVLTFCCCFCEDDHQRSHRTSTASSIKNRYLRLICFLIVVIFVAVLTSITLSLQRKVDSIDWSLRKLDQAIGSPLSAGSPNQTIRKPMESVETLITAQNELNSTVVNIKTQLDKLQTKLDDFQSKLNVLVSKPDNVAEVKGTLGTLGSRVEELSSTIEKVQENIEQLKKDKAKSADNASNSAKNNAADGSSGEPQSTKTT